MIRLLLLLLVGCTTAPAAAPLHEDVAPPQQPVRRTAVISSLDGVVSSGWAPSLDGFTGAGDGCMLSFGAGRFVVIPALVEGDRMLSLTVALAGNRSADLAIKSVSTAPNGSLAADPLAPVSIPSVPDMWRDYPIDLVDTTVAGGVSHWFEFGASRSGLCVGALRLTYEVAP